MLILNLYYIAVMMEGPPHLLLKILHTLYSRKESYLLKVCYRQRQTAILTHNFFFDALVGAAPARCLALMLTESLLVVSWDCLTPDWLTDSNFHMSICIYHFITLTISFQPRDCCCVFSQLHPVQRISDWRLGQGSLYNI